MSLEEKHNEQTHSRSDCSPLLRTRSTPEICPRENTSLKRNLKLSRLNSFKHNATADGKLKSPLKQNESLIDISAMSVVSLYHKQNSMEDMDTDRYRFVF